MNETLEMVKYVLPTLAILITAYMLATICELFFPSRRFFSITFLTTIAYPLFSG